MRDAYVVSYPNGACGTFISSLIYSWLTNKSLPLVFSQYGDAHENEIYRENWNRIDSEVYTTHQILSIVNPKNNFLPFVLRQHWEFDRNIALEKFPNYINIRITIRQADNELLSAFKFFKILLKNYNNLNSSQWNYLSKNNGLDPNELTEEQLRYYLSIIEKEHYNNDPYWDQNNYNSELFLNNEFMIKFNDIIFNKDKVLNYLSNILEKPITPVIEQSYKNYINANKNLINLKCPWINF